MSQCSGFTVAGTGESINGGNLNMLALSAETGSLPTGAGIRATMTEWGTQNGFAELSSFGERENLLAETLPTTPIGGQRVFGVISSYAGECPLRENEKHTLPESCL